MVEKITADMERELSKAGCRRSLWPRKEALLDLAQDAGKGAGFPAADIYGFPASSPRPRKMLPRPRRHPPPLARGAGPVKDYYQPAEIQRYARSTQPYRPGRQAREVQIRTLPMHESRKPASPRTGLIATASGWRTPFASIPSAGSRTLTNQLDPGTTRRIPRYGQRLEITTDQVFASPQGRRDQAAARRHPHRLSPMRCTRRSACLRRRKWTACACRSGPGSRTAIVDIVTAEPDAAIDLDRDRRDRRATRPRFAAASAKRTASGSSSSAGTGTRRLRERGQEGDRQGAPLPPPPPPPPPPHPPPHPPQTSLSSLPPPSSPLLSTSSPLLHSLLSSTHHPPLLLYSSPSHSTHHPLQDHRQGTGARGYRRTARALGSAELTSREVVRAIYPELVDAGRGEEIEAGRAVVGLSSGAISPARPAVAGPGGTDRGITSRGRGSSPMPSTASPRPLQGQQHGPLGRPALAGGNPSRRNADTLDLAITNDAGVLGRICTLIASNPPYLPSASSTASRTTTGSDGRGPARRGASAPGHDRAGGRTNVAFIERHPDRPRGDDGRDVNPFPSGPAVRERRNRRGLQTQGQAPGLGIVLWALAQGRLGPGRGKYVRHRLRRLPERPEKRSAAGSGPASS